MKKILNIIIYVLISILLTACNKQSVNKIETSIEENNITESEQDEIMEGMNYLFSWNTEGIYLDVHGGESDGENYILMPDDELFTVEIESSGKDERILSVQVMVDYKQVPIIIDDEIVNIYTIHCNDNISLKKDFKFAEEIDTSVNHKITVILTRDADKYAGDISSNNGRLYGGIIALDSDLVSDKNNQTSLINAQYEESDTYEDNFVGIFFTQAENSKRKIMDENVYVAPGDKLKINYHAGGYSESDEVLILLNIGNNQGQMNGKDFLICKTGNSQIAQGSFYIDVPREIGKYEIQGLILNNPNKNIEDRTDRLESLDFDFRFTLNVVDSVEGNQVISITDTLVKGTFMCRASDYRVHKVVPIIYRSIM